MQIRLLKFLKVPRVGALFASVGRLLHIFTPRYEKHSRKIFLVS